MARTGPDRPRLAEWISQLHPNGWRFAPGHTPTLELIGTDLPYSPRGGGARRTRRCRGPLSVAIRARVVRRDTKVRRDCLFARTVTFRRARPAKSERRRGSRARTRVVVRFGGNRALKASRASARVRLRPAR